MKRMLPGDELAPWMSPSHPETPDAPAFDMSITVGQNTADKFGLTREDMDAWAYRSHMRAVAGDRRRPVRGGDLPDRGDAARRHDEDLRRRRAPAPREPAWRSSPALKPLHPEIEGFAITAGNSSGLNDGGAAMVLVDSDYAEAHGLKPLAKIVSWASIGCQPARHRPRPDPTRSRRRSTAPGMTVADVDLAEINEAFASVPVAACRKLGLTRGDHERERLRLLARSPGRGHRRPHDHHDDVRARAGAAAASASRACARAAAWARRRSSRSTRADLIRTSERISRSATDSVARS